MAYRTILINFQDPKRAEQLISAAIGMADSGEAHIIGLYVIPKPQYFYSETTMAVATEVYEAEQKFFQDQADKIKAVFQREMPQALASEWRVVQAQGPVVTSDIVEHGRCCDLIVTAQVNPETDMGPQFDVPERVVMESGRPVLILPYAGTFKEIGGTVLAAWNGTRESARAVFDALPLLKAAKSVRLLWINPSVEDGGDAHGVPGSEMAATLSRHGVNVEAARSVNSSIGVDDELLSRASDFGADLLVMGAYGHSRVREYVFGGATRGILRHMTLPVLMSH